MYGRENLGALRLSDLRTRCVTLLLGPETGPALCSGHAGLGLRSGHTWLRLTLLVEEPFEDGQGELNHGVAAGE